MKYICEGMEYNYHAESGKLFNNYGTHVASVEFDYPAREYLEFIDVSTLDIMHRQHIDMRLSDYDIGRLLVEQFTAFNM